MEPSNQLQEATRTDVLNQPQPAGSVAVRLVDLPSELLQGQETIVQLELRNDSGREIIYHVETGCNCMIAQPAMGTLTANSLQIIELALDTRLETTRNFHRTFRVRTNHPEYSELLVTTKIRIVPFLELTRPPSQFLVLPDNTDYVEQFEVRLRSPDPVEILNISTPHRFVNVAFELKNKLKNGGDYSATIAVGSQFPVGKSPIPLVIQTTSARYPQMIATITAIKGVFAEPAQLNFRLSQGAVPELREISIRGTAPFQIIACDADSPEIACQTSGNSQKTSNLHVLSVQLRSLPRGVEPSVLTVRTDHPAFPRLVIPIRFTAAGQ